MHTSDRIFQSLFRLLITAMITLTSTMTIAQTTTETNGAPAGVASSQSSEKPLYNSSTERDNALLAIAKPDEIQWLETPNEKVLALFKAGEQKKTKGAILILHASELSQRWPATLDNL